MKLFDLKFGNDVPHTCGLFYKGGAAWDKNGGRLIVAKGGIVSFATYFNLLPYCVYRTYCGVESVFLRLSASGGYVAKICLYTKDGCVSVLKTVEADGDLSAQIQTGSLPGGGFLFFTVYSEGGCEIYGGSWECAKEPVKDVRIGIAICTFKREKFVKANLAHIAESLQKEPEWADRLHVFVVDNAKTLDLEDSPCCTYIPNRNLGGSGGFTRGMCAVADDGGFTHILLMDDDIVFDFEAVKRTWRIAALLTPEHEKAAIGGTMLILENPCVQQELGGMFDGMKIRSVNGRLDVSKEENLLKNASAEKADYQGWWFCCMPASCVKEHGLPMPFFIKFDDVEYGLKCCKDLIIDNGIAVWHGGFDNKTSGSLEYYIKRNEAAVCAMRYGRTRFSVAAKFLFVTHRQLIGKDYGCAEKIIRGYEDFMQGSNFYLTLDRPEELNAEIMADKPVLLTGEEIEKTYGFNPAALVLEKAPKPNNIIKKALLFCENYAPPFMIKKKTGVSDVCNKIKSTTFMKRTVIRYNSATDTGYVCEFDAKRRKTLRKKITKIFFRLLFGYGKIRKDYRENADKMCSRERWDRLFNG